MEFGDKIKKRREELNITQKELAELVGYSGKASIAKIETGAAGVPVSKVEALAEALGISPAYLMGWGDEHGNDITGKETFKGKAIKVPAYFDNEDIEKIEDYVKYVASSYKNESNEDIEKQRDLAKRAIDEDIENQ